MPIPADTQKKCAEHFSAILIREITNRADLEEKWRRWHKSYRGLPEVEEKTSPWPGASNLVVGLVAIYVDSLMARIMQSMFALEPHWVAEQLAADLAPAVKPVERYLDWGREHVWDQYRVVKHSLLEACKLGTGIIENGWNDLPYIQYNTTTEQPEEKGRITGPCPQWVPRADFLCAPGFCDIQEAPWVMRRMWYSWEDLQQMAYDQQINPIDPLKDQKSDELPYTKDEPRTADDETGLFELWQAWFRWDLDGDGYPEEYCMLFHDKTKTVLKFYPNPYLNGLRPFVKFPFIEQEGEFDGIGIPEMIEMYQEEVSTSHNQRIDNAHLANTKMIVVRKGSGVTDKEKFKPGKFWFVTDPKSDIQEFRVSEVYPSSYQNEQMTISLAERRVGLSDVSLGRESAPIGRAAATTVMALLQEQTRRFDLNTSELRRALSEQCLQIIELYQTHGLPEPQDSASPESVLGAEDGQLVRMVFTLPDNIRGLLQIRLNVATAAVNKEVEKQSALQLLGVIQQYFQSIIQMAMQLGPVIMSGQAPPALPIVMAKMLQGIDKMMDRVFQANQAFDLEQVLVGEVITEMMLGGQSNAGLPGNVAPPQGPVQGGAGGPTGPNPSGNGRGLPQGPGALVGAAGGV